MRVTRELCTLEVTRKAAVYRLPYIGSGQYPFGPERKCGACTKSQMEAHACVIKVLKDRESIQREKGNHHHPPNDNKNSNAIAKATLSYRHIFTGQLGEYRWAWLRSPPSHAVDVSHCCVALLSVPRAPERWQVFQIHSSFQL